MLTLTEQDDGRQVRARVGEVLEVRLAENATAGYRWAVDADDARVLEPVEQDADYPDAAVGAGGQAIFRFKVVAPGAATLRLKYWRRWEGEGSAVKRFAATIDAAP